MNSKKLKIVRTLKEIGPKVKLAMFSQIQDLKIGSKYIDYIIPDNSKDINKDNEKLEKMVIDTLVKEFSPEIKEMKSFKLLVEQTVHNIKKKQLEDSGCYEDIEP